MPANKLRGIVSQASNWIKSQIVQEVPDDIALCEFDCSKEQCCMGEWETCERRLEYEALKLKNATARQNAGGMK